MKLVLIFSLAIALASRGCENENEAGWENETIDEVGYVAEDVKVRKAVAEWQEFLQQSDEAVFSASKQISRAVDRLDNPEIKSRGRLKSHIIKAQGQLEKLSDKLLKANKLTIREYDYNETVQKKMDEFESSINEDIGRLNETLKDLTLIK